MSHTCAPHRAKGHYSRLGGTFTHAMICACGREIGYVVGFNDGEGVDECCAQCGLILNTAGAYTEPHQREDGTPCQYVRIFDVRFCESEIVDGDHPRDDTREEIVDCAPDEEDTAVDLAVKAIEDRYLTSGGGSWFCQPGGSEIVSYTTGERSEVSAALYGFTPEETAEVFARVD